MKAFAELYDALDATTRTQEKLAALETYFRTARPLDAAWALRFLCGYRLRRALPQARWRRWVCEAAQVPAWLLEECYAAVGDLAETLALLLPIPNDPLWAAGPKLEAEAAEELALDSAAPRHPPLNQPSAGTPPGPLALADLVEHRLLPLAGATAQRQKEILWWTWAELEPNQRFLWHKMLTGNFRVGVARGLVEQALARLAGVEAAVITHRLMGDWIPSDTTLASVLSSSSLRTDPAQPYPFCLAAPLTEPLAALGLPTDWQCEWKWDGIRAQVLRRAGQTFLWSRGGELITDAFPELVVAASRFPDGTVLDGEILAWKSDRPLTFTQLQRRLNRSNAAARIREEVPATFMAYDLLEWEGVDWRTRPLAERRRQLEAAWGTLTAGETDETKLPSRHAQQADLFAMDPPAAPQPVTPTWQLSPLLAVEHWEDVSVAMQQARARGTEGVLLKRRDSAYGSGRERGVWWKWKVDPFHCDAVLVAAQPGHGRRAGLFTDYTFALWSGEELLPVAKAYSGLTDAEIEVVDAFVRANTVANFGPVRGVKPELVFELAFEGIASSTRHRSGLALRFPRIARWRRDKAPAEADRVETLQALLAANAPHERRADA